MPSPGLNPHNKTKTVGKKHLSGFSKNKYISIEQWQLAYHISTMDILKMSSAQQFIYAWGFTVKHNWWTVAVFSVSLVISATCVLNVKWWGRKWMIDSYYYGPICSHVFLSFGKQILKGTIQIRYMSDEPDNLGGTSRIMSMRVSWLLLNCRSQGKEELGSWI